MALSKILGLGVRIVLLLALASVLNAEAENTKDSNEDTFRALEWRFVGPMRGGRVNAVVGHPTEKNTFYAGYTGGGVWMTPDAGNNWINLSDSFFPVFPDVGAASHASLMQLHCSYNSG